MTPYPGFELLHERAIPELNTTALHFRHLRTGAEVLSLVNDDENKSFGVVFRTLPDDSTGVAHILEHAVLCGSRNYPVKEPFKELLQGSLKTFLNAFTYPDRTVYPIASQNLQDFYNLIEVYLDAVFYPLLSRFSFIQEGWRYDVNDDSEISYTGVVLNEMKGAYSSPDDLLETAILRHLFPDNIYGLDSGGDPARIPDLTYEQFLAFHRSHYHPSNALFFFYGDDPADARLEIVDRWLADFERQSVDGQVPVVLNRTAHPRFASPRLQQQPYIPGDDAKTYVTVNWALSEPQDNDVPIAVIDLSLGILGHILIGTPASPLYKALIDSGLGEDVTGLGLMSELRQTVFSTGLKGVDGAGAGFGDQSSTGDSGAGTSRVDEAVIDAVETLILSTLKRLVEDGIDPRTIAASLNTIEFRLRENNTGGFPRGLAVMLRGLSTWLYGGDPLDPIAFEAPLQAVKAAYHDNHRYFEDLIQSYLLDNPHRLTLVLYPDPDLEARQFAAEAERLAAARIRIAAADQSQGTGLAAIRAENEELRYLQETPDSAEALAVIPHLSLSDLDRQSKHIPIAELDHRGSPILYHDLFTNGIAYVDAGFNLRTLPSAYLPYVALFGRLLLETGTAQEDFVSLSQRIGSQTGGIYATRFTGTRRDRSPTAWMFLRGKATVDQTGALFDILHDVLQGARLDNRERIRQIVLEEKASEEGSLLPAGHAVVLTRLGAQLNVADWAAEQMGGVSYLFFLRKLASEIDADWPAVQARLEAMRSLLIGRHTIMWNVTVDSKNWALVQPQLAALIDRLPASPANRNEWSFWPAPHGEGLTIPAPINFVGKGADLNSLGYELHGSIYVLCNLLNTGWLWERVRMQGGAYSVFANFDQRSGLFRYVSYRDPNIGATLDAYDRTADYVAGLDLGEDEMTRAIIGVIGQIDAHMLPDAKGWVSMQRYLLGETDALRQQMREQILDTTNADLRAFASVLHRFNASARVVVLGSEAAMHASGLPLELIKVL